jgi:hypothetical protein
MRPGIAVFAEWCNPFCLRPIFRIETCCILGPATGLAAAGAALVYFSSGEFCGGLPALCTGMPTRGFYSRISHLAGVFNFLLPASRGVADSWPSGALSLNGRIMVGVVCSGDPGGRVGLINASVTRVRRIKVSLPNLPASWQGRTRQ